MPHSTPAVRSLRRHASPRGLALDRQLLPRRRGDRQAVGMPVRCGAAGGHEPGTFRLARGLGSRSRRHSPHAGYGKQRQGDIRRLQCPGKRRAESDPQPVFRNTETISCTAPSPDRHWSVFSRRTTRMEARPRAHSYALPVRPGHWRRAIISSARSAPIPASSKRWNARRCSTTAMANTISRASATNMFRSFTTSWVPIS